MEANSHKQRFSPLQIALAGVAVAFLIAILFVVVMIYQSGQLIREKSQDDTQILATIANIQRHGLLLQVETDRLLNNPSIGLDGISEQRSFISAQLRTLNGLVQDKAEILAKINEIEASLNEFDALLSSLENSSPSDYKTAIPIFDDLFEKMDKDQIKQAYDLAEHGFFSTLSEILKAQENAQLWLLGLWISLLALVFTAGAWQIRTTRIRYEQQKEQQKEQVITLEQRVADRTKALATSTEVSRRISTIPDQKQLVTEVVNQVKNAFGYYHAQIYFYDEAKENLVMAGGTGEAGEKMLAQFHKVAKGIGLVGRAAESNQAVLVSDTSKNPEWLPNVLLPETESEAAIPITLGDQVLGVLDVQHNVANGLQQEDVDLLQSIANQVAVAIQNIRQYENTRKIAADMGVVANVGIATSTITEAGPLLQAVVELSKQSFKLYHAHIYLLNEAGDSLELASGAGEVGRQMVSEKRSIPLDSEQSLVARAARQREGVTVNDVTVDPTFLPNPLLPDTRSEMAVPMLMAGKVIGVLDVQSETANRFTDVDISIQTTLASQVAVALQNARSFAQTQQNADRETMLNLITQKIQNAPTIQAALQTAARELGHALGMKSTLVTLDPDANVSRTLAPQASAGVANPTYRDEPQGN